MPEPQIQESTPQVDDLAIQEKKSIKVKFDTKNRIEKATGYVIAWGIYGGGALIFIAFLIRVLHCILPEKFCWMATANIDTIDKFLKYAASSTVGGFVISRVTKKNDQA